MSVVLPLPERPTTPSTSGRALALSLAAGGLVAQRPAARRRCAFCQSSGVFTLKKGATESNSTVATRTSGRRSRMLCAPRRRSRSMCGRHPGPYTACSGSRWSSATGSATSTSS